MGSIKFPNKPILEPQPEPQTVMENNVMENKPVTEKKETESLNKKEWFGLLIIAFILISIGAASGWYLSTFDKENYKHKLTQTLSRLEVEKKQTANALKKNMDIQNEFQFKLASLSAEFINLKNTYQSNLLAKDTEIKLIKTNLPTNFVVNTITNIVTNTVTNKIPTQIEKFKNDITKKIESIDVAYKKETESEDIDSDKLDKLEKNKKVLSDLIIEIDKFKEKNNKDVTSFIEGKIKQLNSKGIGYGTNRPNIKLK